MLIEIYGFCFYSNRMYSSFLYRSRLRLFLLRIIPAGATTPAPFIEVPRLSRRVRALRGSRWLRGMPKLLYALTALAEVALRFNSAFLIPHFEWHTVLHPLRRLKSHKEQADLDGGARRFGQRETRFSYRGVVIHNAVIVIEFIEARADLYHLS